MVRNIDPPFQSALQRTALPASAVTRRRPTPATAAPPRAVRLALLSITVALTGCSGGGEDVRVRLCKDIVAVHSGTQPAFEGAEARTRGREHAEVRLTYSLGGEPGSASCFYAYNAVEDTAQQLAEPLSAYSASPYRVIIGMETLSGKTLARAIGLAMQRQGKQFIEQAGERARQTLGQ